MTIGTSAITAVHPMLANKILKILKIKNMSEIFPLINFLRIFVSEKGGLGAALPDQLGFFNFTWLSIYQKGMEIAWLLIHTKSLRFLNSPNC